MTEQQKLDATFDFAKALDQATELAAQAQVGWTVIYAVLQHKAFAIMSAIDGLAKAEDQNGSVIARPK